MPPISIFEGCTDYCGWIAGIVAIVSLGSFGVPIKGAASKIDVHPLVMQTYKTIVCFLTCWLVLLMGEEIRWTSWGIVSGLFWVPGATCGIYGIRNAGLAIAVGTWSSIVVISSFIWGILVFEEHVKSITETAFAFIILMIGLVGMARYSKNKDRNDNKSIISTKEDDDGVWDDGSDTASYDGSEDRGSCKEHRQQQMKWNQQKRSSPKSMEVLPTFATMSSSSSSSSFMKMSHPPRSAGFDMTTATTKSYLEQPLLTTTIELKKGENDDDDALIKHDASSKDRLIYFGGRLALTRRELGILAAAMNGAWGGLSLIPMHHVREQGFGDGASYLISFASGSLIVNIIMWIGMFVWYYSRDKKCDDWSHVMDVMPKFHLRTLWWPGLLAGMLYSMGNFGSIICVTYLGQGVGYSLCQAQLLISGLWGIFYYKEIQDRNIIMKWFASALLTIGGILLLTHEHEEGSSR